MGFWDGLRKVAQGKPVFEAPSAQSQDENSSSANGPEAQPGQNGTRIIPEVHFEHCKSHINGSEMEVRVWAKNQSAVEVELDKMTILNDTIELDRILMPNQAYEITIYKGELVKNDDNEMVHLQYKNRSNGDYFRADFTIEFNYDERGFYEVEELHPITPVTAI